MPHPEDKAMSQPESKFIQKVHRRVPPISTLYRQKMEAGTGTPDFYYEGHDVALWVEYKVHPNKVSDKQDDWIKRHRSNGGIAWVATYHPKTDNVKVENGSSTCWYTVPEFAGLLVDTVQANKPRPYPWPASKPADAAA